MGDRTAGGAAAAAGAVAAGAGSDGRERFAPDVPATALPGVGPATAARLAAAGIECLRDLLLFLPRRHREVVVADAPRDELVGRIVRMTLGVEQVKRAFLGGGRSMVTVTFRAADQASVRAAFFGRPWLAKNLIVGQSRRLEGRLGRERRGFVLDEAEFLAVGEVAEGACSLRYRSVPGVSAPRLRALVGQALRRTRLDGFFPPPPPTLAGRLATALGDPAGLLRSMHEPRDVAEYEGARLHLALLEAIELFRRLESVRRSRRKLRSRAIARSAAHDGGLAQLLGFEPTADQARAMGEIRTQLAVDVPAGILLQGDVGTGKTAVALDAALAVVRAGAQVAFLAPTGLLAEQHHAWIAARTAVLGVRVARLTAAEPTATRRAIEAAIAAGEVDIVVGTHALLSDRTRFRELALVIVDEHHRFGVEQRRRLARKGVAPHLLVMSATPIPRTLTLALFGDLDGIELRERPAGRVVAPALFVARPEWSRVLRVIARHVRRGGRVFVVCPRVGEGGEKGGAIRLHSELAGRFRCGLIHGRMPVDDRRKVGEAFREGRVDVLVGTTVLEVGIDVAAATLMVVVAAEQFGLATLHQLRGRVGRGARRGLCVLTGEATARTAAVVASRDGFALAEEDLRLRGAGELCGVQQSGAFDFGALEPLEDRELLRAARDAVRVEGVTA